MPQTTETTETTETTSPTTGSTGSPRERLRAWIQEFVQFGLVGATAFVVDATLFLPDHGRDARVEFEAAHIPGAVFFDIEEIADTSSGLPFMLPKPEKFASRAQALGLGDGSRIVVYDNSPLRTARITLSLSSRISCML